jgi:hypothetical protein
MIRDFASRMGEPELLTTNSRLVGVKELCRCTRQGSSCFRELTHQVIGEQQDT